MGRACIEAGQGPIVSGWARGSSEGGGGGRRGFKVPPPPPRNR